jgi:hypothetical protein
LVGFLPSSNLSGGPEAGSRYATLRDVSRSRR